MHIQSTGYFPNNQHRHGNPKGTKMLEERGIVFVALIIELPRCTQFKLSQDRQSYIDNWMKEFSLLETLLLPK